MGRAPVLTRILVRLQNTPHMRSPAHQRKRPRSQAVTFYTTTLKSPHPFHQPPLHLPNPTPPPENPPPCMNRPPEQVQSIPTPRAGKAEERGEFYPAIRRGSDLGWQLDRFERDMILGGEMFPQRQSMFDLLQNCDLPPPLKLFPAAEKPDQRINTSTSIVLPALQPPTKLDRLGDELGPDQVENTSDLLKALRLSQTRAREAERTASALCERNEQMITLLLKGSWSLFGHRQLVRLLEIEVSWLRRRREEKQREDDDEDDYDDGDGGPSTSWTVALPLCLGIAGVGIALGCRYLL